MVEPAKSLMRAPEFFLSVQFSSSSTKLKLAPPAVVTGIVIALQEAQGSQKLNVEAGISLPSIKFPFSPSPLLVSLTYKSLQRYLAKIWTLSTLSHLICRLVSFVSSQTLLVLFGPLIVIL